MVTFEICGFCKHVKGPVGQSAIICPAYPNGLPLEVSPRADRPCAQGIFFEPKEEFEWFCQRYFNYDGSGD